MLAIFLVSLILMWKRRSSALDLWLLLALWAWFIETALLSMTSSRYSLAWYAGKVFGLLCSTFVLIVLLWESIMLHARLAISVAAEKRQREDRRMSMEVMVAAIAHELKQPLSAIILNSAAETRMLVHNPPDWEEIRAAVEDISRDGHRATQIIESIRLMFATGNCDRSLIDVNELVHETLVVIRIELKAHGIALALESFNLPPILGNKGQLMQVLSNVITNAIESMATITDRTHLLRIQSKVEDSTVSLMIEDSGTGIDSQTAGRIFEPFFTTKSKGMGLGLAICKSIVESHLGQLSVAPGNPFGSTFRIDLPVAAVEKTLDTEREHTVATGLRAS
jgi:signal transduction histidine kinase